MSLGLQASRIAWTTTDSAVAASSQTTRARANIACPWRAQTSCTLAVRDFPADRLDRLDRSDPSDRWDLGAGERGTGRIWGTSLPRDR
jgi:hypothetical protein